MLKVEVLFLGVLAGYGFCEHLLQYSQNDYILTTERFEYLEHNDKLLTKPIFKNFKYNRTKFALNMSATWKQDIHGALMATVQGYKFASNEYRLFPLYFVFDSCDAIKRNIFGLQNIYNCGNMFRCPIKKGPFLLCNWDVDYTQLPPHFPRGRYMASIIWKNLGIVVMKFNWYVEIKDVPLPY